MPSVGAGTANTEFEVLTGMNLRYFGPGEYPYKTVLKCQTAESAATALENFGHTHYTTMVEIFIAVQMCLTILDLTRTQVKSS